MRSLSSPSPLNWNTRIAVFLLFPFEFQFTVGTGDLLSSNRDLDLNGAQFSTRAVAGGREGSRDVTSTSRQEWESERSARKIKECWMADRAWLTRYCFACLNLRASSYGI